ncbi:MAG: mechanosensitive ion channel [Dissulfuribacterales bacterium]
MSMTLHTVKVQNWDKTITTIPTYKLIEDSFKNWRGMSDSGGRRIKRSILIDQTSIRFCDDEMIEKYEKIQILAEYVRRKKAELDAYNKEHGIDTSQVVNGRRMTNMGTFRAYVIAYLRNHPKIRQDLTFLVRQLAPTPEGLPLEIYVFSNDIVWANYEAIQADIFDHILAVVPEFGIKVFQKPSGYDLTKISGLVRHYNEQ